MSKKTIVTCAVTGNLTSRAQHPGLPITPEEIATASLDAASAGAAIVHIHARDPETGKGSMKLEYYSEIVERIRDKNQDLIINLTTGEGGRYIPSDDDPRVAAEGSTLTAPERRVAHVEALKPDICTLDFNTMWSGQAAVINSPRNLQIMAERIYAAGVKPEFEIFDTGDLQMLKSFIDQGIVKEPVMVQFVLGVRFGATAVPATMAYLVSQLPDDCVWAGFGIGRMEFPMVGQAFLLGGHVRVGMEDNLYIARGELVRDNAQLVERAVTIVENLGARVIGPEEVRAKLGLVKRAPEGR